MTERKGTLSINTPSLTARLIDSKVKGSIETERTLEVYGGIHSTIRVGEKELAFHN